MNEAVCVYVLVVEDIDQRWIKVKLTLQDDTEQELVVEKNTLELIENSKPAAGWLSATYSGEQHGLAMVELPQPILNHGHRVTLKTENIKRRSLEEIVQAIKPQSTNKGISPR